MGKQKREIIYSDIDLSRWNSDEYRDIITDSLWLWQSRDSRNGHKFDYHGNFIPQIPNQLMRRYTKQNEIVVDWFLGSGTSAIEAANLGRKIVGVELQKKLVQTVENKLPREFLESNARLICADSTSKKACRLVSDAIEGLGSEKAHLAILHPPYADIIRFTNQKKDLSVYKNTKDFVNAFRRVAKNAFETLENTRFAALVIGDKYANGELDPLGFKCMQAMNDVGFKTKSIIVKNIEGNEIGKGKTSNLWRYRALAGGFYIFKHEYVMVFFKP